MEKTNLQILKEKLAQRDTTKTLPMPMFDLGPIIIALREEVIETTKANNIELFEEYRKEIKDLLGKDEEITTLLMDSFKEYRDHAIAQDKNEDTLILAQIDLMMSEVKTIKEHNKKEVTLAQPDWFTPFPGSKFLNTFGTFAKHIISSIEAIAKKAADLSRYESPLTPLNVVLVDPNTHKQYRPRNSGGSGGSVSSILDGYSSITPFHGTVTTHGIPVRISTSSITSKKILIQAGENAGIIVVGNSNVSAATRNGLVIYPTNEKMIEVNDVSALYIDSADDGSTFNGYYLN